LKQTQTTSESLKLSGNEFQTDGPATEKVRRPNTLSRYTAVYTQPVYHGTTRSRRLTLQIRDVT